MRLKAFKNLLLKFMMNNGFSSMTGYGSAQFTLLEGSICTLEIQSVNKRGLEIYISSPKEWGFLDNAISQACKERVSRGKLNIIIRVKKDVQTASFYWNEEGIQELLNKLKHTAKLNAIPFEPTTELLLNLAKTASQLGEESTEEVALSEKMLVTVNQALDALLSMRQIEGEKLKEDLLARLALLQNLLKALASHAAEVAPYQREQFHKRLEQTGLEFNLDDDRILRELALFADKSDISEELTRLKSHLEQFTSTLQAPKGSIGRKLDFLCQEIHREINTTGNKANFLPINHIALEFKNELERIREQVQNVE